jgi:hypothetical protein
MLRQEALETDINLCSHNCKGLRTMLSAVNYRLDWRAVCAQYCLLARFEVYSGKY